MAAKEPDFEVIIGGGGMVGATLACALAERGVRTALLEGRIPDEIAPGSEPDARVSALSPASQRIFQRLGVWDGMTARRVTPYRAMEVWDQGGAGRIHFDAAQAGEPLLGHIVENRVMQRALLARAESLASLEVFSEAWLAGFEIQADRVRARLDDGRAWTGRLLVGADGRNSKVRAWAGIQSRDWDYEQLGVVATVRCKEHHQDTAWQRFLPTGPLAFLPLWDGRCSIVWSAASGEAKRLMALDDAAFRRALGLAFEHRLGEVVAVGPRTAFPLRMMQAERYAAPRVALIGDAAHTVHPLAGQGANLGLLDAAALAEVVLDARDRGRDVAAARVLARYQRWRKGHNLTMSLAFDGINRLFSGSSAPLRALRTAGLSLADRITPLKLAFMRQAMGNGADHPALAKE